MMPALSPDRKSFKTKPPDYGELVMLMKAQRRQKRALEDGEILGCYLLSLMGVVVPRQLAPMKQIDSACAISVRCCQRDSHWPAEPNECNCAPVSVCVCVRGRANRFQRAIGALQSKLSSPSAFPYFLSASSIVDMIFVVHLNSTVSVFLSRPSPNWCACEHE